MENNHVSIITVFNFFDYREYLQAVYSYNKDNKIGFSHRSFALYANIPSPNYLFRILKGERNLSLNYVPNFCKALKLNADEANYFTAMVQFNNEKNASKKEEFLQKMLTLRYSRGEYKIDDNKLLFFKRWYYPIIRELAIIYDFKDDYNLLARNCIPRLTSMQAKSAVNYLVTNGFLKKNKTGKYTQTHPVISTGSMVNSTILRKYHRQTLLQSVDALDAINLDKRDISSLTMSVSENTYHKMKKEIQDFRKRLLALAREDKKGEIVCHAGFQLIPKSKTFKKTKE